MSSKNPDSYSHHSWAWRLIPHKHYWKPTIKGFTTDTHKTIRGWQCFRCWRAYPYKYETNY